MGEKRILYRLEVNGCVTEAPREGIIETLSSLDKIEWHKTYLYYLKPVKVLWWTVHKPQPVDPLVFLIQSATKGRMYV